MAHPAQNETIVDLDAQKEAGEAPKTTPGAPPQTPPERLYGGQYKTVEELEAAYAALNTPTPPDPAPPKGPATIEEHTSADAADALSRAGLNLDEFAEEFNTKGALSTDSYTKLQQAGFPKELVDVYVDGLKARLQGFEASVYSPVGGKAEYESLIQWAKSNVSDEHKRVFNEAIQSGDKDRAALAVQALIALRGGNARLLTGKTSSPDAGVQPYPSQAQAVAAVRDPRYRTDPAYRAQHDARLSITPLFN